MKAPMCTGAHLYFRVYLYLYLRCCKIDVVIQLWCDQQVWFYNFFLFIILYSLYHFPQTVDPVKCICTFLEKCYQQMSNFKQAHGLSVEISSHYKTSVLFVGVFFFSFALIWPQKRHFSVLSAGGTPWLNWVISFNAALPPHSLCG